MKKRSLIFVALLLALSCCAKEATSVRADDRKVIDFDTLESNDYTETPPNYGALGEFNLIAPANGAVLEQLGTFTWEACENAERYSLEICSHPNFIKDSTLIDYYVQDNIVGTSWSPTVSLMLKDTTYYWRVSAINGRKVPKTIEHPYSFFVEAPEIESFEFDLGEADDWQLHPTGSYADIGVDNSDFFGNGQKSIVVSFKKEDTMRGIPESDGWIVVTKTIEKNTYGTDSLFFEMYYAGQDADIFVRIIDRDNEFWVCPIKVSINAKQKVFLKFDDFVQRTGDVTENNHIFNHERIKSLEIVFERSFGDGVLLISNMKAVKFSSFSDMLIDKLDFTSYREDQWSNDSYQFEKEVTQDELTIKYWGSNSDGHPSINSVGYGFAKIAVGQYFYSGDAIKVKVKYTGYVGSNLVIRIYEEDTDRWFFRMPFSNFTAGEYQEFLIPFDAFGKSSINGDGKRQFYYIINIQFGVEGVYSTGTASFKDFEVVKKKDYKTEEVREVGLDGVIEDFNNYNASTELYLIWEESVKNKDEFMLLNTKNKIGGANNPYCGQFEYKADMEPAIYELPVHCLDDVANPFTSFSIYLKDASLSSGDVRFSHLDVRADTNIYIKLSSGEIYNWHLGYIDHTWNQYILPFADFELSNIDSLPYVASPITAEGIVKIGISFQYFYYDYSGKPVPMYIDDSPVYLDNITLGHDTSYEKILKEKVIHMDGNIAAIDDFEAYRNTDDLNDSWIDDRNYAYQHKELSNEVSSRGGSHSMAMNYKGNSESPSYFIAPAFDSDVKGRAIKLSMYAAKPVTVYLNLYFQIGTGSVHYRATISAINTQWTEYVIGLSNDNFDLQSGSAQVLSASLVSKITRISFGIVYWNSESDYSVGQVYVDDIRFDNDSSISYATNTRTVIE